MLALLPNPLSAPILISVNELLNIYRDDDVLCFLSLATNRMAQANIADPLFSFSDLLWGEK